MSVQDDDEIVHYYPLENIEVIRKKNQGVKIELLNDFLEFYNNLKIITPDLSNKRSFKGGNRVKNYGNNWKRKTKFKRKDLEKFLTNSYVKKLPDNDIEKIRRVVISNLNKLNEKKFTIIVKEFIDNLEELMYSETYDIINKEIMDKVYNDTYYVTLYSKLVKELIINKKWQKKMFNVVENDQNQFYWTLNKLEGNNEEFTGPFGSFNEAIDDAMENNNYKISFCNFLQNSFRERDSYQVVIKETESNFEENIYAKNKYNNFLRLIFGCVEYNIFRSNVIHHALFMLISTNEIDQFIYLYDLVNKSLKINNNNLKFYEEKLIEKFTDFKISPKTKFKLQEYFNLPFQKSNTYDVLRIDSPPDSPIKVKSNNEERDIDFILNEYPLNGNYDNIKEIFTKVKNYNLFYDKFIQTILDGKESNQDIMIELLEKLWSDNANFCKLFGLYIDKNLINMYGECEVDYPNSRLIFMRLLNSWLIKELVNKDDFLKNLRLKTSDDEDEKYNIELFNDNILDKLKL